MTRVLKRPMFRIGGPANEGITSGLGRPGYEKAGSVQDVERRKAILRAGVGQQPDTSLSQFLIDFGLNVASAPPSGSIFSTAAAAAKEPFQGYKASKAARGAFEQQIGLSAATSSMQQMDELKRIATKNLNKDDRMELDKLAQRSFDQGLYNSYDEAWMDLFNKKYRYSKAYTKSPEAQYQASIEDMTTYIQDENIIENPFDAKELAQLAWTIDNDERYKDIAADFDKDVIAILPRDFGQRTEQEGVYEAKLDVDSGNYKHNGIYIKWPERDLYRYNNTTKTFHLYTLGD
jgi:hypothetical protein